MRKWACIGAVLTASCSVFTACQASDLQESSGRVHAQIWADNWFALYSDGELVIEDSDPATQERSFNVEAFDFDVEKNAQLAIVMKDYVETDSGLEYIGSRRQQVGDGGFIAQFYDVQSDQLIAVSSSDWLCTTIHQAPLNLSCARSSDPEQDCQSNILAEPEGWMTRSFDDSDWSPATEHSARAVRPHGEYSRYTWEPSAKLIWGEDLEIDNTILCRFSLD